MVITRTIKITAVEMVGCGHTVYMPEETRQWYLDNRPRSWFCTICGHKNYYGGESEAAKLKRVIAAKDDQLDTLRRERDGKERQLRAQKGVVTRIKNRISKGVCPCCNRTFGDLERHMKTKHPDYAPEEPV